MQTTTRSSFGATFCPFILGSLSHLNEALMQQGFDVMVTRRTRDVATPALGLGVIRTCSLETGTAVVRVVVTGVVTLVVVGFETPCAEVGGAKESG